KGVQQYRAGNLRAASWFDAGETAFLAGLGCSAQELFDFVEDFCQMGEPAFETVLLITALRRDYFLNELQGRPTGRLVDMATLPAKDARLGGIAWLPRIIVKAQAKLRGEMPAELMYCCGGDRQFLKSIGMHPADFLRLVWRTGGDEEKVLAAVKQHTGR
ncbi:MAG: DUF5069 domain-containing protein, partial [Verrucomicrobia bacterium]|nr:DUF5069 domain-containing protein [Verrucomicrobiota bacterium]